MRIFQVTKKIDLARALLGALLLLASTPTCFAITLGTTIDSAQSGANLGSALYSAGDVNSDGFSDVLVAAPNFNAGMAAQGRVYLFLGSSTGIDNTPDWSVDGDQIGARLGAALGSAGDINADGYSDVLIGAPGYDNGAADTGQVLVFLGSASGLEAIPSLVLNGEEAGAQFGSVLSTAGDINADGFSDVLIGTPTFDNGVLDQGRAQLFLGSASGLSSSAAWSFESGQEGALLGSALSFAGDLNGDGFADVLVGASGFDATLSNQGKAFVFFGSASGLSSTPDWSAVGEQAASEFGSAVSSTGDLNADGYADLIVSAPKFSTTLASAGRVYIYLGSALGPASSPALTLDGDQAHAQFGSAVGFAGDLNADGFADVLVAAWHYNDGAADQGKLSVFFGSATGLQSVAVWSVVGDQGGALLGASVAVAGDVNGDGFSDILVGASGYDSAGADNGRAYIYLGAGGIPSATADWSFESNQISAGLGAALSSAGDVNGDGFSDFLLSAPNYDGTFVDQGRVYLFFGSATGPASSPDWIADGDQVQSGFGFSAASAGDVNGDGYSDVIIGARFHDNGETNEGRALLYLGSASGLGSTPVWSVEPNQNFAFFGYTVAGAGDLNGDGYADVAVGAYRYDLTKTDEGAVFVYLGSSTGPSETPTRIITISQDFADFGISLAAAGDVNRDGYSDLVVGSRYYTNGQMNEGGAFLFYGTSSGIAATPAWIGEANQAAAAFGIAVAGAGDVNGDGYSDVVVGARFYDAGESNEGRAYLFLGSATGLSRTAAWITEGNQVSADHGSAVSGAGDVNGDGFSDVLVGAYRYDSTLSDEGRASLYLGSSTGLATLPAWTKSGAQISAAYGLAVASAGDVNADGFSDLLIGAPDFDLGESDEGLAQLFLGNGVAGVSIKPQQLNFSAGLMQPLGVTRDASYTLRIFSRGAIGRTRARLVWQSNQLGSSLSSTTAQFASVWVESGLGGVSFAQEITALAHQTNYHWRARIQYFPLLNYSGWVSVGNNGVNEADLRAILPPTPTPTATSTHTSTPDPDVTALATETPSILPTDTVTPTPSIDASATPTEFVEHTPTPTPSEPLLTATITPIGTISGTPPPTSTPTPTRPGDPDRTDSDGDGIPDDQEGPGDRDSDGVPNYLDIDSDNDGIEDRLEGRDDQDEDGLGNYLDWDSDGDGINDNFEGQSSATYMAPTGRDEDFNGLDDGYEGLSSIIPVDTDLDGEPDFLDPDCDDDGESDYYEAFDFNGNGRPDIIPRFRDGNRDGLDDAFREIYSPLVLNPDWRIYSGAPGCRKKKSPKFERLALTNLRIMRSRYDRYLLQAGACSQKLSLSSLEEQQRLKYGMFVSILRHEFSIITLVRCPPRVCHPIRTDRSVAKLNKIAQSLTQLSKKAEVLAAKSCKGKLQLKALERISLKLFSSIDRLPKTRQYCRRRR